MPLSLVTAAVAEPILIALAKKQCRVDHADDDSFFTDDVIPAARDGAELGTQRQLIDATYDLTLDTFPCDGWIDMPKPPLRAVVHVKYVDTAGVLQTLTVDTDYRVHAPAGPRCARGRITLPYGVSWPSVRAQAEAVTVRFTAGYGTAGTSVPPLLRRAMLMHIATMYAQREDFITGSSLAPVPESSSRIYESFKSHAPKRQL